MAVMTNYKSITWHVDEQDLLQSARVVREQNAVEFSQHLQAGSIPQRGAFHVHHPQPSLRAHLGRLLLLFLQRSLGFAQEFRRFLLTTEGVICIQWVCRHEEGYRNAEKRLSNLFAVTTRDISFWVFHYWINPPIKSS